MNLALLLKLLHVFSAFWFVSGLIGRWVVWRQAAASPEIHTTTALLRIASFFDRYMVILGSQLVVLLGIITGIVEGWPVLGFLQGGKAQWLLVSLVLFLITLPLIPAVFIPRRKVMEQALQEAVSQGQVTPSLTAALQDKAVRNARVFELAVVAIIILLMIAKPF